MTFMKKTYINPNTIITVLGSQEHLLQASANFKGDVDVTYGGRSTGGMSSDVKGDRGSRDAYNVWNDDWSQ